ncbi:MAG: hypothetical protein HXY50_05450 [Ignavibacteriaceae bacterium]|nr:hypothetical protein [Ignavibacteriaceae bacterium]
MMRTKYFWMFFGGMLFSFLTNAQILQHVPSDFRGDINFRKNSNVDGNNIRVTIFNSGYSGNPGNRPDYVNY